MIGDKNERSPVKIPHRFCVLGPFILVDYWTEKANGKKVIYYRYQKIDTGEPSWWEPQDQSEEPEMSGAQADHNNSETCGTCNQMSPQRYSEMWLCTNPDCEDFWKGTSGRSVLSTLTYDPSWLRERSVLNITDIPYDTVAEAALSTTRENLAMVPTTTSKNEFRNGKICPQCRACVARAHWNGWHCQTEGCGWICKVQMDILPAETLINTVEQFDGRAVLPNPPGQPDIIYWADYDCGPWLAHYYFFTADLENFVAHFESNKTINSAPGGPHEMFERIQRDEQDLVRNKLKTAVGMLSLLCPSIRPS